MRSRLILIAALFLVMAAIFLLSCAHAALLPWPAEVKASRIKRCVIINIYQGREEPQAQFFCSCIFAEVERLRPVGWLLVDDTPEDAAMEKAINRKCAAKTLAAFPETPKLEPQAEL